MTAAIMLVLLAGILVRSAKVAWTNERPETLRTIRRIRWRHLYEALYAWVGIIIVANVLYQVPVLQWGWWSAIGGDGNSPVGGEDGVGVVGLLGLLVPLALMFAVPREARFEEEVFREGIERMTRWGQFRKALVFGLVHATMGIPIAFALALTVGGLYFNHCYLRTYRVREREMREQFREQMSKTEHNLGSEFIVSVMSSTGFKFERRDPSGAIQFSYQFRRMDVVDEAVDEATAAHTVYNWMVLSVFFVLLVLGAVLA